MATIYRKTALGQAEIETRSRRITPRERSALILVDGKRSDEELHKLVLQPEETLQALMDGGLIEAVATTPSAKEARAESGAATREKAPEPAADLTADLAALRRDAVRAVNDLLGPGGEALAIKLERAPDAEQLRQALERAVAYISNARGGGAAAQFANRFLKDSDSA